MAKCTPTVDIREVTVIETIETQTGVTLELSNVEAHVAARVLGLVFVKPSEVKIPAHWETEGF